MRQKEKDERMLKERLEHEREKVLYDEIDKYEKEKDFKKGKKAIKQCGIMDAYDSLIKDMMQNGTPEIKLNGDLFEYAAFFLTKYYHKK